MPGHLRPLQLLFIRVPDLSQRRERVQVADATFAWLNLLRERAEEIEEDTPEAFAKRQQLARLLVERITLYRGEGRKTTVVITYRFGTPDDRAEVEAGVVSNERNAGNSSVPSCKPVALFGAQGCR